MLIEGEGKRVSIYIGEADRHGHKPLSDDIVELLRAEGCAGATVYRGVMGFGADSRIKTSHVLVLSQDLPVTVVWVDSAERVARVLPLVEAMLGAGLVTVEDVHIVRYGQGSEER